LLTRRTSGDEGAALILVIGILTIVTTLVAVASMIAINSLRSSTNRVTYEAALSAAENGIDFALARLQKAFDDYNADYPIPTTPSVAIPSPSCTGTSVPDPAPFASAAAERTWAKQQLTALLAAHPECVQQGGEGEFLVFKPQTPLVAGLYPKSGKVYAMGWVPAHDAPNAKTRLLKAEYIFMPYRPTHAVLSSGDIAISSSTTVTAAYGIDPLEASVHSNGSVSGTGNPTVTGPVTSTGSSSFSSNRFTAPQNSGGAVAHESTQRIPGVDARSLYFRALSDHPEYDPIWYDLCDDGTARSRSASGPCTSATILNPASTTFRGWSWTSSSKTWVASRNTQDGIYFVDKGNVDVGTGNAAINNISVIASSENPDNCGSKKNGNIQWDHYELLHPAYQNLWLYADGDIVTHSNFTAGSGTSTPPVVSGMFVAGDQMQMETSSQGAVGSVLVGNQCPTQGNPNLITTSEIKNPAIYYDPNSDAPFTSIINTTLWLEYPG
jgi:hypothetical protein